MIRIVKARNSDRENMIDLFIECFKYIFVSFTSDYDRLKKTIKHIFIIKRFYVAKVNDEIVGMVGVSDGSSCVKFNKFKFIYYYGFSLGLRMYKYLKCLLEEKDYAFEIDEHCGFLEYLCIKENYRNQNIALTLMNHSMLDSKYRRYLVKVANNNYVALKLLDKIGFEVFDEESATSKEKKENGIEKYYYMIIEVKV